MTKTKSTKRALLTSALALLMCVSMLIGSTFAWFTDSVTSSGNIIKSGTLDVTMEWLDGKVTPTDDAAWIDASKGAIFNSTLWEPGYTEVRHIKIANEGTLALKYQLNIIANGEVSELADVIDVYYIDPAEEAITDRAQLKEDNKLGTLTDVLANISTTASGNLLAGEKDTITLALKMQETAGNEYQNLAIGSDFSIQLLATQLTSESDSFNDQYDAKADYVAKEVATAADLLDAIADGGNVKILSDITLSEKTTSSSICAVVDKEVVIDLNGHDITSPDVVFYVLEGGKLTINGDGNLISGDGGSGAAVNVFAYGGEVIINGGTYSINKEYPNAPANHGADMIYAHNGGTITINGGTFKYAENVWTLNLKDNTGSAIVVKGGTFEGFNPANNVSEGLNTNFVADGYVVTAETKANGDVWYTVAKEVATAADLLDAIADGGNVKILSDITLSEKTTSSSICAVVDKEVVIDLNGHNITSPDVVFYVLEGGKLTINGDGNLISGNGGTGAAVNVFAYGGEVIINGGTYSINKEYPNAPANHGADMIYAHNGGTITINGGTFKYAENVWTLNLKDNSGSAIIVKGGTFEGFNPANNVSEGLNTNFVADGYVATENNGTWTVTAE